MSFYTINNIVKTSILLEEAEDALTRKDYELFQQLFLPVWDNIYQPPDFENYEEEAKLYQLAAEFLTQYGRIKGLKDFQERGKDLATKSLLLFQLDGNEEESLFNQIILASSYCHEGADKEYLDFLLDAEQNYNGIKYHPYFLKLQINLLTSEIRSEQYEKAKNRIELNKQYFENTESIQVQIQFFNEAGIFCRRIGNFEDAFNYFQIGISLAQKTGNPLDEASILNNLSATYRDEKKFDLAIKTIDQALDKAFGHEGWEANFLDTKALILFEKGDLIESSAAIKMSIGLFKKGDDYGSLCDALFNQAKIFIGLDLREDGLISLTSCIHTAFLYLGDEKANKYVRECFNFLIVVKDGILSDKMKSAKKQIIENSLNITDGHITDASELLGMTHQTLSAFMKKHPDLYEIHDKKRKNRTVKKKTI